MSLIGGRPTGTDNRAPVDVTQEDFNSKKRWPLGVSLLRGILFFLAMSFTFSALFFLNVEKGNYGLIIFIFCCVATVVAAVLKLFRSTVFESILLVITTLIFLNTAYFEFKKHFIYFKFPEKIRDSVTISELRNLDSIRVIRFKDARVVSSEIQVIEDSMNLGTMAVLAPIVDTWRDSLKGDSVFAFVVGYSYDTYNESIIGEWEDTCRFGTIYRGPEYDAMYGNLLEKFKEKTGRSFPKSPIFIEKSCYYYLNDGDKIWELIGVFIFLLFAWIIIVSVVRGITMAIQAAGKT